MVEMAIEVGKTVIVDQVTDKLSLSLISVFRKKIITHGGQDLIQFARKNYKHDPNFELFVVCNQPDPLFDINVTNYVTQINFTTNLDSLTTQLLGLIIKNERNDLESAFLETQKDVFDNIKSLKGVQATLIA